MFHAFAMYMSVVFLATWLSSEWRRRICGAGFITDITVHIVLQSFFGGDAQGRASMLFAGLGINATMHAYRKLFGYEKLTTSGWVRYPGVFTKPTAGTSGR